MSARAVAARVGLSAAGILAAAGCSSQPQRPAGITTGGSSSGGTSSGGTGGSSTGGASGAAGTGASAGTAGSATGGSAGAGGTGGSGGSGGGSGLCGNGVIDFGEQCDGTNLGGRTCKTLGFDSGSLACKACSIDQSGCTGKENCTDGIDNDGDRKVDCNDTDCTAFCADSCANAVVVSDPADVSGLTTGHAAVGVPSCARPGSQAAPAVVYELTAKNTGMLDVLLNTTQNLLVAVRTSCADSSSESYCGTKPEASIPVTQGDTVYVVVTGDDTGTSGTYDLALRTRVPACGDGVRDPGEECDDGNTVSGDGCSSTCTVESSETEPNDSVATANPYVDPFYGQISAAGDVDVAKVTVPDKTGGSTLTADTFDYGDGACSKQLLDSKIDVIGTDGSTVITSDDDSGAGLCAHAVASGLAGGTYYVRVEASPAGDTPTFPYVLKVAIN